MIFGSDIWLTSSIVKEGPLIFDEEQLQAHFDGKGVFYFIGVEPFACGGLREGIGAPGFSGR